MAKNHTKPAGGRDRSAPTAKSAAQAPPSRPVAKPVAKTQPAKPVPKAAPGKAPAAKAPAAKAPPPRPAAKKAVIPVPVKTPAAKAKPSGAESSAATEAEIMKAVSGKLASRAGGGMSWLGSRSRPPAEEPKVEAPAAVVEVIEEPVPEPVSEVIVEEVPVVAESAPEVAVEVPAPAENVPVVAEPVTITPTQEAAPAVESEVIMITAEPVVTPPAVEPETAAPLVEAAVPQTEVPTVPAAVVSTQNDTLVQAIANAQALSRAFKTAVNRLGWTLVLQGLVFVAFFALVKGGTPQHGLPHFLACAVPLFAMGVIVAFVSFQPAQHVLDQLESDRLRYQQLLSLEDSPPDTLTKQRTLARWAALLILAILFVIWLFIGVNVWFH
jgi:hypothetical protein